jgi:hypothetical protein
MDATMQRNVIVIVIVSLATQQTKRVIHIENRALKQNRPT